MPGAHPHATGSGTAGGGPYDRDEITLAADSPAALRVRADAISIAPMDSLQIIVNGSVARTLHATDPARMVIDEDIEVPGGGWVAARVIGPSSRYVSDSYAFAHTSPVYIVRGGRPFVSPEAGRFLADAVSALWSRHQGARWRSAAERDRFEATVAEARNVYEQCARG